MITIYSWAFLHRASGSEQDCSWRWSREQAVKVKSHSKKICAEVYFWEQHKLLPRKYGTSSQKNTSYSLCVMVAQSKMAHVADFSKWIWQKSHKKCNVNVVLVCLLNTLSSLCSHITYKCLTRAKKVCSNLCRDRETFWRSLSYFRVSSSLNLSVD